MRVVSKITPVVIIISGNLRIHLGIYKPRLSQGIEAVICHSMEMSMFLSENVNLKTIESIGLSKVEFKRVFFKLGFKIFNIY